MAKVNLYGLYDLEAQTVVGPIVPHARHGAAARMFNELLADKKTTPGQYPNHFHLVWVGELDTDSAIITPVEPTPVATGADWLKAQEKAVAHAYELDAPAAAKAAATDDIAAQREQALARLRA